VTYERTGIGNDDGGGGGDHGMGRGRRDGVAAGHGADDGCRGDPDARRAAGLPDRRARTLGWLEALAFLLPLFLVYAERENRIAILTDGRRLPISRAGYARLSSLLTDRR
jgi:hypothetical protein